MLDMVDINFTAKTLSCMHVYFAIIIVISLAYGKSSVYHHVFAITYYMSITLNLCNTVLFYRSTVPLQGRGKEWKRDLVMLRLAVPCFVKFT